MKSEQTRNMTFIALMAALMCVTGPIVIPLPFSPVPISIANLTIYLSTIIIGMKRATVSVLIYILIGGIGVPVFSGFSSGFSRLVGPTGGYLIGFIFMALFTGFFVDKFKGDVFMYAVGMVIGTLFCYTLGTIWLSYTSGLDFKKALLMGVAPFVLGDIIKVIISCLIGEEIRIAIEKS